MRNLAKDGTEEGKKIFKENFGDVLDAIDPDTFILCSGRLSKMLYEAARFRTLLIGIQKPKVILKNLHCRLNKKRNNH